MKLECHVPFPSRTGPQTRTTGVEQGGPTATVSSPPRPPPRLHDSR